MNYLKGGCSSLWPMVNQHLHHIGESGIALCWKLLPCKCHTQGGNWHAHPWLTSTGKVATRVGICGFQGRRDSTSSQVLSEPMIRANRGLVCWVLAMDSELPEKQPRVGFSTMVGGH